MTIRFDGQVAIVTGAGGGLGRSHALELAKRGAKVVVNDLGGDVHGEGASVSAAQAVADKIIADGGEAIVHGANVCNENDVADMINKTISKWGRIDVLINNAGILRDKSFAKMDASDVDLVVHVHLIGSATCSRLVWPIMRDQGYGRIVMTTSSSGLYGNFGQANYGAAKLGLVGLMNTLCIEGSKYDIRVNALAPVAATRMTDGLMPPEALEKLTPESVTAGLITLCDKDSPNRIVLAAGAGGYAVAKIFETEGIYLPPEEQTAEAVRENFDAISDEAGMRQLLQGSEQSLKFLGKAMG